MTVHEVTDLVNSLSNLIDVLTQATPEDNAEVYRRLGIRLTFHPDTQTAHAQLNLDMRRGKKVRVEGPTRTIFPHTAFPSAWLNIAPHS